MTALVSYSTGTVSVAAGGTIVTGVGSIWSDENARPGDILQIGNFQSVISDKTDTTHLVIPPWGGGAQAGVAYKIWQVSPQRFAGSESLATVNKLVAAFNTSGYFVFVDVGLTEPDPSLGDDGQYAFQPTTGKTWVKSAGVWSYLGIYKAFQLKGAWSGATAYTVGDVVTLNGSSYACILDHTNHAPPNATYWQLLASIGPAGNTGPAAWTPPAAWATATAYTAGPPASVVVQSGETYVCLVSHTSGAFASDLAASKWIKVASAGGVASLNGQIGALSSYLDITGRVTPTSLTPEPQTSVAGATQLYFTPTKGNGQGGLGLNYDGTNIFPVPFQQLTNVLANSSVGNAGPAAVVPNACYDLYFWVNGSTPTFTRSDYFKKSATVTMTIASPAVMFWAAHGLWDGTPIVFTSTGALPAGLTAGTTYFTKSPVTIPVTITIGSPGVVTWNSHGMPDGTAVVFNTSGALPTGLTAGTTYYTINGATNSLQVAATVGGAPINTSGSQSGVHTATATSPNYFNVAATVGGAAINTSGSQSGTHTATAGDDTGAAALAPGGNCEQLFVNGLALNKNAIANGPAASRGFHVGTIRTNPAGTVDFIIGGPGPVAASFGIANVFNYREYTSTVIDLSASYTYSSTTWRQANGLAAMSGGIVVATSKPFRFDYMSPILTASAATATARSGIGYDTMSVPPVPSDNTPIRGNGLILPAPTSFVVNNPTRGWHRVIAMENADGTNASSFNLGGSISTSGLKIKVWL
ncbi:hypothetical protein J4G43_025830 [Bradyrhizobium barranii subsp. barranii]|uniref:Chitin-binding type-3 domain-containing protein n=1 Tax=Bradyrhizobium barranii subsp. barranii TaxID=2823807 RepID=A0A939M879_9BRAD|nr:carbohydrate-binding protein [Bradyrhizobium barranii]UEM08245.1 hypothetical protein J4G43_025830 [Bradyrhizobium barranii subsp. barranii]